MGVYHMPETVAEGRVCTKCSTYKTAEHFDKDGRYAGGLRGWCKACYVTYRQLRRKEGRSIALERQLRYGISVEQQAALWVKQGGKCAACRDAVEFGKAHMDHSHASGTVRAFLCAACNLAVGHSLESPQRLRACADYLEQRYWIRDQ